MPAGRPTKYSEEMVDKAYAYLANYKDHGVIPTTARLARVLGIARSKVYSWGHKHPEFGDILEAIQAEQEAELIDSGLTGDFTSPITKLLLVKHGYHEKMEQDVTTNGENINAPVEFILSGVRPSNG